MPNVEQRSTLNQRILKYMKHNWNIFLSIINQSYLNTFPFPSNRIIIHLKSYETQLEFQK